MDDVIQRLVEIDRKCVERVEAAKVKKLDAQTNMNEKRKEIYEGFVAEQNKKIEEHKAELMNKNQINNQLNLYSNNLLIIKIMMLLWRIFHQPSTTFKIFFT